MILNARVGYKNISKHHFTFFYCSTYKREYASFIMKRSCSSARSSSDNFFHRIGLARLVVSTFEFQSLTFSFCSRFPFLGFLR